MTDHTKALSDIAEAYVKLRDKIKEMEDDHKKAVKPLKELRDALEVQALERMDAAGIQSLNTTAGPTVYTTNVPRYSVSDREALNNHVRDAIIAQTNHPVLDIFGNTLSKDTIKDYFESTGELPPGVKQFTQRYARFNRS